MGRQFLYAVPLQLRPRPLKGGRYRGFVFRSRVGPNGLGDAKLAKTRPLVILCSVVAYLEGVRAVVAVD